MEIHSLGDDRSHRVKTKTDNSVKAKRLIAIVDDDASVRVAIDRLLRSLGHRCVMYESAEAFLATREADGAACLICDIHMDGMSGFELQEVLLARGSGISTILITAFLTAENEARAAEIGTLCILPKPFNGKALVRAVGRALSL